MAHSERKTEIPPQQHLFRQGIGITIPANPTREEIQRILHASIREEIQRTLDVSIRHTPCISLDCPLWTSEPSLLLARNTNSTLSIQTCYYCKQRGHEVCMMSPLPSHYFHKHCYTRYCLLLLSLFQPTQPMRVHVMSSSPNTDNNDNQEQSTETPSSSPSSNPDDVD